MIFLLAFTLALLATCALAAGIEKIKKERKKC
jgi:hypothetical protein